MLVAGIGQCSLDYLSVADVSGLIKREDANSQLAFIAVEKGTARRTIFWKRPSGEALKEEELGVVIFFR
ncbi:MAG: hypothetical protein A2Y97_02905 [Nitrospirae bacterium RBG_13_39_12]|nr:MAG: hypothetical protein A2Y97_02905 [Nitrospirae bacterium RBG_13_39_12]